MFAFLNPATKLREGNIFTSVFQEFCPQRGGACMAVGHAWWGHAWQGVCVVGTCMVGCMHGMGHVWWGDMHSGGCVGGMHALPRHYEIWSMSGWYAFYWTAFLYNVFLVQSVANISGMLLMEQKVVTRVKSDHISVCGEGGVVYVYQTCILPLFLASLIKNFK